MLLCFLLISISYCLSTEWNFLSKEPDVKLSHYMDKEPQDSYGVIYAFIDRILQNDTLTSMFRLEFIDKSKRSKYKHINDKSYFKKNKIMNDRMYLDFFELDNNGSSIILRGTSIISITNAFGYYLDYYCNTTYDWTTYKVHMPEILPLPSYIRKTKSVPITFMNNEVTFSYSYTFWSWKEWEKHIDWYAINGINYPLAFTGQEYIWSKVYYQFGFNTSDLINWFSGPAFSAWQRFGNIKTWGGELREYYIINEYNLQLQILSRMYSFEMNPILTCFAGHVPDSISRIYPEVDVTPSPPWGEFTDGSPYCCSLLLNFSDPLFTEIGSKFIEIQTKYYGTSHIYQCDSFNEEEPPSNNTGYLYNATNIVYNAINNIDENGIWMLQTWMFYFSKTNAFWNNQTVKAFLNGVNDDEVILLDVYSEQHPVYNLYDSFYGKLFIWNTVSTFGGKDGFYGNLNNISVGLIHALEYPNTSVVGIGSMLEGIWTNYIVFDMTLKMAYCDINNPMNQTMFIDQWKYRRYGFPHILGKDVGDFQWIINNLKMSWDLFQTEIYNTVIYAGTSITWPTPTMSISEEINVAEPKSYDIAMQKIWKYYIEIGVNNTSLNKIEQFMHDLTDITRQCLGDVFDIKYQLFQEYYHQYMNESRNEYILNQTKIIGNEMIEIITDLDNILNTNKYYQIGRWINWAINKSDGNINNTNWLNFNARNQITLWGPGQYGNYPLSNYARKQWSGVIKDYYGKQWQLFVNMVIESMINNFSFNQSEFDENNFNQIQIKWVHNTSIYPIKPTGNTVDLSCKYFLKWNTINATSCAQS